MPFSLESDDLQLSKKNCIYTVLISWDPKALGLGVEKRLLCKVNRKPKGELVQGEILNQTIDIERQKTLTYEMPINYQNYVLSNDQIEIFSNAWFCFLYKCYCRAWICMVSP